MNAEEMKLLTKQFAIDVGKFVLSLNNNNLNRNYSNQIIRSSSSVLQIIRLCVGQNLKQIS